MICSNCQSENPESNRFCGMCGERLAVPVREQVQETRPSSTEHIDAGTSTTGRRPFIVSTTAVPDSASRTMNSRVMPSPSIASSTFSSPLRANDPVYHGDNLSEPQVAPVDPSDEPLFTQIHEVDRHPSRQEHIADVEDTLPTPTVAETPVSGSVLGLTAPVTESTYHSEGRHASPAFIYDEAPVVADQTAHGDAEIEEPIEVQARHSFLQFDEPQASYQDVSGPSFLGLSTEPEYLTDEEQTSSHGRLYVFLFILIVIGVLGALEWRASQNGDSTNPMDVLHLKLPKKKGQGEVVVMPPSSNSPATTASNDEARTSTSGGANNGKPDLIAEPNQSASQKSANAPAEANIPPQSSQSNSPAPANSTPATSEQAAPPPTAPPTPAPSAGASIEQPAPTPTPELKAKRPVEIATAAPPADAAPKSAAPSKKAPVMKPRAAKTAASTGAPSTVSEGTSNAGAFELQKGIAAGDSEMSRMWLWKALAKGNSQAPVMLADIYAQGRGVPKDCDQAILLLNTAAKKPNALARSRLGSMYATGQCVPMDRVKAYKWMSAALEVNPGSDWTARNRDELLRKMTPAERQRAMR